jgi:anti-anti-sigma factor
VLVDCTKLDYVNSAGLKVFLLGAKQLDGAGGKLVLCGLTPSVQAIFDMIGFSKIMNLAPERDAALRMFQGNGAAA